MSEELPIPEATYPCGLCIDDECRPPSELCWSSKISAWVCENCARFNDVGNLGPLLSDELNRRAPLSNPQPKEVNEPCADSFPDL